MIPVGIDAERLDVNTLGVHLPHTLACTSTVLTRRPPRTTGRRQGRCRLRQTTTHKHEVSHGADLILEELPLSAPRLLSA
jgi:hypothetical protein